MSTFNPSQRSLWSEGQPISELMSRAFANPGLISLAAGFVDQQTLPVGPTQAVIQSLMADDAAARAALQYGTTPGFPPLRQALLEIAQQADPGLAATADQIVVTAGSNQLLHLVAETILNPGDIVLCASPTYLVFLGTTANLGARTLGIETDDKGMIPGALQDTLKSLEQAGELHRVKAIYLVPYFDNPTGACLSVERRQEIVDIARQWSRGNRIHVIADEAYRELRYTVEDTPGVQSFDENGDTVIVAGTFSKSYSPGMRIGWGILPQHLVGPVCSQKGNIDFGSPNFCQHVMAKVLSDGLFRPHVEEVRQGYQVKLNAMLAAAEEYLKPLPGVSWLEPGGGLYVWLTLPGGMDAGPQGKLFDIAIEEGVLHVPGEHCFSAEGQPAQRNTIRLSFGVQSPEGIRNGVAALARAIQRCPVD